ncbi:MAG: hypothetical protein EOO27_03420 [Comamonadaceae bacterium]|nr:MAG: hypothetical protein EOO27_03420 [Comamonadaceae bacterium]
MIAFQVKAADPTSLTDVRPGVEIYRAAPGRQRPTEKPHDVDTELPAANIATGELSLFIAFS